MAHQLDQDLMMEAIAWHLRLREGGNADWEAFVDWLEADPARSDAYDRVEIADAEMGLEAFSSHSEKRPSVPVANDNKSSFIRSRWVAGFASIAAMLLVVMVGIRTLQPGPDLFEVTTALGEQRTVDLGQGSEVVLNGGTRLALDRNAPRWAELLAGEATFSVRHDDGRPFIVRSGEHEVKDVGTSFNLIRRPNDFSVEVIEGEVIYNPKVHAIHLSAGQALHVSNAAKPVVVAADPEAIAGWRHGRLNFSGAPLGRVADDLSRTLGVAIAVDAGIATQPLTGSIRVQSDDAATIADLALVAGVQARPSGNGWIIEPLARAPD